MRVEPNVVTDLASQLLEHTRLVIIRDKESAIQGDELEEPRHPDLHVVLEELREVLIVQAVEDFGDEDQRPEDNFERVLIP